MAGPDPVCDELDPVCDMAGYRVWQDWIQDVAGLGRGYGRTGSRMWQGWNQCVTGLDSGNGRIGSRV